MNTLTELKTNDALWASIVTASSKKQSAEEIREQRVSFIFGSIDKKTDVTRSRIQEVLAEQLGVES